jgi:hypothetical protein
MRKSQDNSEALAAFIARKTEIDTILACLTALSSDHFSCEPETVTWSDVAATS